jgi:hypothetical protein
MHVLKIWCDGNLKNFVKFSGNWTGLVALPSADSLSSYHQFTTHARWLGEHSTLVGVGPGGVIGPLEEAMKFLVSAWRSEGCCAGCSCTRTAWAQQRALGPSVVHSCWLAGHAQRTHMCRCPLAGTSSARSLSWIAHLKTNEGKRHEKTWCSLIDGPIPASKPPYDRSWPSLDVKKR